MISGWPICLPHIPLAHLPHCTCWAQAAPPSASCSKAVAPQLQYMHKGLAKIPLGVRRTRLGVAHTTAPPNSRPTAACNAGCRAGSLDTWDPKTIRYDTHQRCFVTGGGVQPSGSVDVTLVTQVSLDRWPRFSQQAAEWQGPVSVAAYIPAPHGTSAAAAGLDVLEQLFNEYHSNHPHQAVTVSALHAVHHAAEGFSALSSGFPAPTPPTSLTYDQLYPINALRNLALTAAATSHALLVDAYFIPSLGLQELLLQRFVQLGATNGGVSANTSSHSTSATTPSGTWDPAQQHLVQQGGEAPPAASPCVTRQQASSLIDEKVFVVVPAFQLQLATGAVVEDSQQLQVPRTVEQLAQATAAGSVAPFHCGVFPQPTMSLDHQAWLHANQPLQLQYHPFWEPFGAGRIASMPLFDERFRGYGLNKQQHTRHLEALGFEFEALPGGFVVTAPHPRTSTWRAANGSRGDQHHLKRIQQLYERFVAEL